MSKEIKEIFETLIKYTNLTPAAIDDLYYLQGYIEERDKEIERLNNIINELEKYLEEESKYDEYVDVFYREHMGYVLDKLKKLKEDK